MLQSIYPGKECSRLDEETRRSVREIGSADILIGIPSKNSARTIGHVCKAIKLGLIKYFPKYRAVIVNLDAESTDETETVAERELAHSEALLDSILLNQTYHPAFRGQAVAPQAMFVPFSPGGKGNAFKRFFEMANALTVSGCAVLDSDLRSITPEWIQLLLAPIIFKEHDFVAPVYIRHKYDGTITNSIVYPFTAALYGHDVRQPIGGEFGFSARANALFDELSSWTELVAQFGIDIWMTTTAITNGLNIAQSILGTKIHDPKDPAASLGPMFRQVVGTMFDLAAANADRIFATSGIEDVRTYGFRSTVVPEDISISYDALLARSTEGAAAHASDHVNTLDASLYDVVSRSIEDPSRWDPHIWARTIYAFALAYAGVASDEGRNRLLDSLVPLYYSWVAHFYLAVSERSQDEAEDYVVKLRDAFWEERSAYVDSIRTVHA